MSDSGTDPYAVFEDAERPPFVLSVWVSLDKDAIVVDTGMMPPWLAAPLFERAADACSMFDAFPDVVYRGTRVDIPIESILGDDDEEG